MLTQQSLHPPFLQWLSFWDSGDGRGDGLFVLQYSTGAYLLHFDRLWVSVLTTSHYTKKLLWRGLRFTVYTHGDRKLAATSILDPFSRRTVITSSSMTPQPQAVREIYSVRHAFLPVEIGLEYNEKVVGYPYGIFHHCTLELVFSHQWQYNPISKKIKPYEVCSRRRLLPIFLTHQPEWYVLVHWNSTACSKKT